MTGSGPSTSDRAPIDIDLVAVEPLGIEARVGLAGHRDRGVEPVADARHVVPRGVDIEMKLRVLGAQFGEMREDALRGEQRQHAEPQPQHLGPAGHEFDRVGQAIEHRRDLLQQPLAILVEHDRLVAPFEQRLVDEAFERLDAAAERGGG